jgi:hypothetical protein
VWYVEDDTVWPYDPLANAVTDDCSYALAHVSSALEHVGLSGRWAYRLADRVGACWGITEGELRNLYRSCDVLLNICGATDLRDDHFTARFRVYLETDPVTSELRLANGDEHTKEAFEAHHVLATYGESYAQPSCNVPLSGYEFVPTRQPVDLDLWPVHFTPDAPSFTTIGNYRQEGGDVAWQGEVYGWSKHTELERFIDLPDRTGRSFELAMMPSDVGDAEHLRRHGWGLSDPFAMSLDVFGAYPSFIASSRAEFTVAKDQNVRLRSGWFSERDACYLASGKPVVAQDTGFSDHLPCGAGLFAVSSVGEAAEAVAEIDAAYEGHCRAARDIAAAHFEASAVANRLLEDVGL